jgi:hypothetical protein
MLLAQVIEAAQTLPEEQLKEVLDFVGYLKKKATCQYSTQPISERTLLELLQLEGLIDELPNLEAEDEPELDAISYTGKPLSEIIIEEREPK